MANTTNFGWETPDDTDLVKDGAAAMRTLGNSIDSSFVDLKGGTTGQVLSKASNTDLDYTWVTTDDANAIQNSIIDAKGDLIAGSSADTPAILSVGSNGSTLVADSAATTGLRWQADWNTGKNKIINGDFRINQRNFSSVTVAQYGFDRWLYDFSGGTVTYSAQTFTAGTAPVTGYEGTNFARIVTASQSTAGHFAYLGQCIEDVRTITNQTVTVSFWAKAGSGTPNVGVTLAQNFGTGGSAEVPTSPAVQAITTSWARYSFTLTLPSIAGKTIGANNKLFLYLFTSCGTTTSGAGYAAVGVQNATIDFWGVQVEQGSVATPFTTATGTLQGELAACQRYYVRIGNTAGASNQRLARGVANSTTGIQFTVTLPVELRTGASSTIDYSSLQWYDGQNATAISSISMSATSTTNVAIAAVTTGTTQKQFYELLTTANTGYVAFSAEL